MRPATANDVALWGNITASIAADHWLISGLFLVIALACAFDWRAARTQEGK